MRRRKKIWTRRKKTLTHENHTQESLSVCQQFELLCMMWYFSSLVYSFILTWCSMFMFNHSFFFFKLSTHIIFFSFIQGLWLNGCVCFFRILTVLLSLLLIFFVKKMHNSSACRRANAYHSERAHIFDNFRVKKLRWNELVIYTKQGNAMQIYILPMLWIAFNVHTGQHECCAYDVLRWCCCCCWFFLFVFLWLVNRIINHLTRAVYNEKRKKRRKKQQI